MTGRMHMLGEHTNQLSLFQQCAGACHELVPAMSTSAHYVFAMNCKAGGPGALCSQRRPLGLGP